MTRRQFRRHQTEKTMNEPRPDPRARELAAQALTTWTATGGPGRWPSPVRTMLVLEHKGESIAWPSLEGGEVADIFRVHDGSIIDEDTLPTCEASELPWIVCPVV